MARPAGSKNKPKKEYAQTGADPVLHDDEGLSPADERVDALTADEINTALAEYIEAGMKVKVTIDHFILEKEYFVPRRGGLPDKKKLVTEGSLLQPIKSIVYAADMLYSRFTEVEQIMAARSAKGGLKYSGLGEVTGRDGKPIDDAA